MDFELVLKSLLEQFEQHRIRYAIIGGFALGVLGVPRVTMDLDYLVHRDDLERLDTLMTQFGYQRSVRTENASHYRHRDRAWGAMDVLHAFRPPSLAMLERARAYPIMGGRRTVQVLEAEDIIGLKVQAIANDPLRRGQDRVDIEALADRYRQDLRWDRVQEYYALFNMQEEGHRLQEQFGHAE